jgi:CBS domain-containing protein
MLTAVPSSSPPPVAELARTPLRRMMRAGVVSVPGNASLLQAARALADHRMHAVLVIHTGSSERVGWLTGAALIERLLDYSPFEPVADAVTEPVTCIAPSATVADAIRALAAPGVTHLLVTNGSGAPQGVVSDADIVRFVATRT